uniref:Uncharacterized protein n=1 Tax=Oryza brachyantha TaxID=4533 RepID=J3M0N2_ORYBR
MTSTGGARSRSLHHTIACNADAFKNTTINHDIHFISRTTRPCSTRTTSSLATRTGCSPARPPSPASSAATSRTGDWTGNVSTKKTFGAAKNAKNNQPQSRYRPYNVQQQPRSQSSKHCDIHRCRIVEYSLLLLESPSPVPTMNSTKRPRKEQKSCKAKGNSASSTAAFLLAAIAAIEITSCG